MIDFEYFPSCHAIYLSESAKRFYDSLEQNEVEEYWKEFIGRSDEIFPGLKIVSNHQLAKDSSRFQILSADTESQFFSAIHSLLPKSQSPSEDWDEVCFLYSEGLPVLQDPILLQDIWMRHQKYLSQYSYSENLPPGIIPRILTREFLDSLPDTWVGSSHDYFLKNINQYDVEIYFHPPDLRQYRLNLFPNEERSLHLIRGIVSKENELKDGGRFSYESLHPWILENPFWLRPAPSWIELELYRGCDLKCTYCPRQFMDNVGDGSFLTPEFIKGLVEMRNQMPGEITYCLGGMGEPFLHPDLVEILKALTQSKKLKEIIIESALYIDSNLMKNFCESFTSEEKSKINFIINITSNQEAKYEKLYGKPLLNHVKQNLDLLIENFPKENVSVQIIKILEIEDEVDAYFNHYEKKGINIIFQKYNRFANLMPEKRVSDLTPIKREFCWHLGRDLYIDSTGKVSICRQVVDPKNSKDFQTIGDLNCEGLSEIWSRGLTYFQSSLHGKHETIPAPCVNCDEWYTFNA